MAVTLDTSHLSQSIRDGMNATYAQLRKGAAASFVHDGLIYSGVPLPVLKGYVAAGAMGQDRLRAGLAAHVGEAEVRQHEGDEDWLGWRIARAWTGRLGELERPA